MVFEMPKWGLLHSYVSHTIAGFTPELKTNRTKHRGAWSSDGYCSWVLALQGLLSQSRENTRRDLTGLSAHPELLSFGKFSRTDPLARKIVRTCL